jgi:hypothetical protein
MMLAHFMLMLTIMMMESHSQRPAMQPGAAREANSAYYGLAILAEMTSMTHEEIYHASAPRCEFRN